MNCEQKFGSKWLVVDFNKSQILPVTAFTSITWQQHFTVSFKVEWCAIDTFLGVGIVNVKVEGCAVDIFLGVNEGEERKREGDPAPETTHHRKNLPRAGDFLEEQER